MGHLPDCPVEVSKDADVVALFENPQTGRMVAVPGEIVREAEREYRCFLAYSDGDTWEEISEREHYQSAKACQEAVKRYLDEGRAIIGEMSRMEMMAIEVHQLRKLRSKLVALVDEGKVPAIMASLAVHDRLVKVFGLDQPDEAADMTDRTVVVPSEEYLQGLRLAAGES